MEPRTDMPKPPLSTAMLLQEQQSQQQPCNPPTHLYFGLPSKSRPRGAWDGNLQPKVKGDGARLDRRLFVQTKAQGSLGCACGRGWVGHRGWGQGGASREWSSEVSQAVGARCSPEGHAGLGTKVASFQLVLSCVAPVARYWRRGSRVEEEN